jgi:hypothetical protein
MTDDLLVRSKKDLIEIYNMLFVLEGLSGSGESSAASTPARK